MAGYTLGLVPFPVASFAVFVSSTHFRLVSYRTKVSDDPDEPVHLLYPVRPAGPGRGDGVDAFLLPTFSAAGTDFWQRCRDLGAELEPAGGFWALVAGVVVYGVVAVSLAISFLAARSTPEPRP